MRNTISATAPHLNALINLASSRPDPVISRQASSATSFQSANSATDDEKAVKKLVQSALDKTVVKAVVQNAVDHVIVKQFVQKAVDNVTVKQLVQNAIKKAVNTDYVKNALASAKTAPQSKPLSLKAVYQSAPSGAVDQIEALMHKQITDYLKKNGDPEMAFYNLSAARARSSGNFSGVSQS